MTRDRFEGCLLGLALGDALGAPQEGGPIERLAWLVLGRTRRGEMRWTDDTQMSLDVAESLIAVGRVDGDDLARRFAESYHWSRGYGPGAAKLLKRIARGANWREASRSVFPDGSWGNGGAMRAPIVGLFHRARPNELAAAVRASAEVTHAHPLGQEGAVLVAAATAMAGEGVRGPAEILDAAAAHCVAPGFRERLDTARAWLERDEYPEPREVVARLGNGIAAVESCVTATYIAVRWLSQGFSDMQVFVGRCGGDVDTIGAMAGAIWGARNGAESLPADALERLEQRERLRATARDLHVSAMAK